MFNNCCFKCTKEGVIKPYLELANDEKPTEGSS